MVMFAGRLRGRPTVHNVDSETLEATCGTSRWSYREWEEMHPGQIDCKRCLR